MLCGDGDYANISVYSRLILVSHKQVLLINRSESDSAKLMILMLKATDI